MPMPTANLSTSLLSLRDASATHSTPPLCQADPSPSASRFRPGGTARSRQTETWKMRLPEKVSTVTYPGGGTIVLAVQCVAGDARVGAAPARVAGAVVEAGPGAQETAESVQAEMDVLRRPRKSLMLRWRITSAAEVRTPSQRRLLTAKLRQPRLQKTIST